MAIHIGKTIEQVLRGQGRTVSWFAKQICCERTNVYSIFQRSSIDTELLLRISRILSYDFFEVYQSALRQDMDNQI
ncbi:MAG: XRE family transcriptional regulator [Paludibacteraceae bacterium]|nr:XRE family transcriptional regulator [Paludibacteraceae bacterium]